MGFLHIDVRGTFENLHDGLLADDLQDLALADLSISEDDSDDLSVPSHESYFSNNRLLRELDFVEDDQGAVDLDHGSVVNPGLYTEFFGGDRLELGLYLFVGSITIHVDI